MQKLTVSSQGHRLTSPVMRISCQFYRQRLSLLEYFLDCCTLKITRVTVFTEDPLDTPLRPPARRQGCGHGGDKRWPWPAVSRVDGPCGARGN